MKPIIKPSSEIRKNYGKIAQLCRENDAPVFLTKNGAGDTVLMDMETYSRREEDLATAERLLKAKLARAGGEKGVSPQAFKARMKEAIALGVQEGAVEDGA